MSRGAQSFKQNDVTKAVRGVVTAGMHVGRVEIDAAGKIVVFTGTVDDAADAGSQTNEWDSVVK